MQEGRPPRHADRDARLRGGRAEGGCGANRPAGPRPPVPETTARSRWSRAGVLEAECRAIVQSFFAGRRRAARGSEAGRPVGVGELGRRIPGALRGQDARRASGDGGETVTQPSYRREFSAAGGRSADNLRHDRAPVRPAAVRRGLRRRSAGPLSRLRRPPGPDPLSRPGGGDPGPARGPARHPEHPDRLGQVAGRVRPALRVARARAALGLHLPHQGPGQREVDGPVPRVRSRERGAGHRRRHRQPRRAAAVLHGRDPGQPGAPRGGAGGGGRRGDGRVPLVRRPRPRRGLAGAPADPAAGALPADVGHARRRDVLRGGADAAHRPADGDRHLERAARAAGVLLLRGAARAGRGTPGRGRPRPRLRCPLHPEGRRRERAELHEPADRDARGEEGAGHGRRGRALLDPLRPPRPHLAEARDRHPPRGSAAALPRARRAARPAGPAQGHLRHRHAGGRRQRADPHRALQPPLQVRRGEDGRALGPRLPPDRRPRGAQGLRRTRLRRRPGPGARHREPAARREGEGGEEGGAAAAAAQLRALGRADVRTARPRPPRTAPVTLRRLARHAAERAVAARRRLPGHAGARARQSRVRGREAEAPAPRLAALPVAGGAQGRRDRTPLPPTARGCG